MAGAPRTISMTSTQGDWPALPLAEWQATLDTLHMYTQLVGNPSGLRLRPNTNGRTPVCINGARIDHKPDALRGADVRHHLRSARACLDIAVSDGQTRSIRLEPRTVAAFYEAVMDALRSLGINATIWTMPQEVQSPIAFERDATHAAYDPAAVERFFHVLSRVDMLMKQHRAPYRGRHTPVRLVFSGAPSILRTHAFRANPPLRRQAPISSCREYGRRGDQRRLLARSTRFPEPAFFAYTFPKPDGLERAAIQPAKAFRGPIKRVCSCCATRTCARRLRPNRSPWTSCKAPTSQAHALLGGRTPDAALSR